MRAIAVVAPWACLGVLTILAVWAVVAGFGLAGWTAVVAIAGLAAWLWSASAGVPPRLVVTVAAVAWSGHLAFQVSGLYDRGEWDTLQHTLLPGVVAVLALPLVDRLAFTWSARGRGLQAALGIAVFAGVVSLMAVWELYEFASDTWWGTHRQDGLTDTMIDLAVGAAGAALGVAGVAGFRTSRPVRRLQREWHPVARFLTGGGSREDAADESDG